MSVTQLRKEFNAVVEREVGYARTAILQYLRNNLPTGDGTLGNDLQFSKGVSLAGDYLYAGGRKRYWQPAPFPAGVLRTSYHEITLQPGTPHSGRISAFVTDSEYAYYYANGRINSDTYHGFDFIAQTQKDIENTLYSGKINVKHQIF